MIKHCCKIACILRALFIGLWLTFKYGKTLFFLGFSSKPHDSYITSSVKLCRKPIQTPKILFILLFNCFKRGLSSQNNQGADEQANPGCAGGEKNNNNVHFKQMWSN